MVTRLGWPLFLLPFVIAIVWGTILAVRAELGAWSILTTAFLATAITFGLLAAYHRGRASAFEESLQLHERADRARRLAKGNGGT